MFTVIENGLNYTSSNSGRDFISYKANTVGKGMNPLILFPALAE